MQTAIGPPRPIAAPPCTPAHAVRCPALAAPPPYRTAPLPGSHRDARASSFFCCLGRADLKRLALPARWRSCPVSYTASAKGMLAWSCCTHDLGAPFSPPHLLVRPPSARLRRGGALRAPRGALRAPFCLPAPAFGPGVDAFPGCGRDSSIHLRLRVACAWHAAQLSLLRRSCHNAPCQGSRRRDRPPPGGPVRSAPELE